MSTTTTSTTVTSPDAPDRSTSRARDVLLGVSGIGCFAILLPVVALPHASLDYGIKTPPASSVITAFYSRHYALEQYQALAHSLAGVLLLVFGVALATQVRRHEEGPGLSSRLVAAGAAGAATVMVVTMLLVAGSVDLTGGIDGRTQGWLYDIGWTEHFKMLYLVPLMLAPACRVLGGSRALPRPLTWAGLLVSVLCPVAMVGGLTAGTEFLQYPVFFLVMIWVLAAGLVAVTRGVGVRR